VAKKKQKGNGSEDEDEDPDAEDDSDSDEQDELHMKKLSAKKLERYMNEKNSTKFMPMTNYEINQLSRRIYLWIFIGVPIFAICVGACGYFARQYFENIPSEMPNMKVVGTVERIKWDPNLDVADQVIHENKPMILTNTIVTQWSAFKTWSFDYLAEKIEFLDEIYSNPGGYFRHFTKRKPMEKLLGLKPNFHSFDTSGKEFFKLLNTSSEYIYWSGSAREIKMENDMKPYEPLAIKKEPKSTNVWISSKGVVAMCHYDMYYNFFVQLRGKKKFILFPPSDFRRLYLHPLHHPGYRQCQINLTEPDFRRFPSLMQAGAYEVILDEGEVLYLPPMWFHHVEALNASISANVWSETEDLKNVDKIFYLPVPFSESWNKKQTYDGTKIYITMIVENYFGPDSAPGFIKGLLISRFFSMEPKAKTHFLKPHEEKFCSTTIAEEGEYRIEFKRGLIGLKQYLDPLTKEVKMVMIEDYIQDLVMFVAGLEKIPAFLEACFLRNE